jgi:hypothetical protein
MSGHHKASRDLARAFMDGNEVKLANTMVSRRTDGSACMRLYGGDIAQRGTGYLVISDSGYRTNLTKDRLNAIGALADFRVWQEKNRWYVAGKFSDEQIIEMPFNTWVEVGVSTGMARLAHVLNSE